MKTRLFNAIKADITFQFRQGFYYVYIFLTLVYTIVMLKIPEGAVRQLGVPLIVFSDPSMVGFFFIGSLIMLEKTQGITKFLGITPLNPKEYLLSKAISLTTLAVVAGSVITYVCHKGEVNWVVLILGISLSSLFCTLYGFLAAAKSRTINQYFVKMVPYMLFLVIPCFTLLLPKQSFIYGIFPAVAGLRLVFGAFTGISFLRALFDCVMLAVMTAIMLKAAEKSLLKLHSSEEE